MAETFKAGDVVKIKSNGPAMTVEAVDGENIYCVWFENNKVERGCFPPATLKTITSP